MNLESRGLAPLSHRRFRMSSPTGSDSLNMHSRGVCFRSSSQTLLPLSLSHTIVYNIPYTDNMHEQLEYHFVSPGSPPSPDACSLEYPTACYTPISEDLAVRPSSPPPDPSNLQWGSDSDTSSDGTPGRARLSGLPPLGTKYRRVSFGEHRLITQSRLHLRISVKHEKGIGQFLAALKKAVPGVLELFIICYC